MSESLITQIIVGIIVDFSKDIMKVLIKVIRGLVNNNRKTIPGQNNYDEYHEKYEKRHGSVRVLGMREFKKLQSIYTEVQFFESDANKHIGKQAGITLANDEQFLIILGEPGAGKSTFLKIIGLEALKGKEGEFKHASIPVFIELKKIDFTNINIGRIIAQELDNYCFPSADKFTPKALEEGKLLILLDGLDQVPIKNLTETITKIQDFVYKYNKNRFIISCREAAYRNNIRHFTKVKIADFGDIQIEYFINNWFKSEPNTGKNLWQKLNSAEYIAAKELTRTPLLLTLLCLLYENGEFSNNRATLYEKVLNVLLDEWADENNILREQHPLDTRRKKKILSEIAYDAFQKNHLFLQRQEITDKIERILSQILPNDTSLRGEDVLRTIEVEHGILIKGRDAINFFSYPSLQKYLTAQYINERHQVYRLVIQHLTDERWKEVFLMVAGLMQNGADELLLLMEKRAKQYINTPKLQALLGWAEEMTAGSEENYTPVRKRAAAIAYAYVIVNTYTIAYHIANRIGYADTQAETYAKVYANASAIANTYNDFRFNFCPEVYRICEAYSTNNTNLIKDAIANTILHFRHLEGLNIFQNVNLTKLIENLEKLKSTVPSNQNSIEDHRDFIQYFKALIPSFKEEWLHALNLTSNQVNRFAEFEDRYFRFFETPFAYMEKPASFFKDLWKKLAFQDREPFLSHIGSKNSSHQLATPINLSLEEAKALGDYLYANHLIIQCKEAAVRVSPQIWEAIEARMLLVSND